MDTNMLMVIAQPRTTRKPDFIEAIMDPTVAEFLSPYVLGALDAERGGLCVPEEYYMCLGQMREYAEGFESVVGRTLLSDQIMGRTERDAMKQITRQTESGHFEWLVKTAFERVETLITYLDNYAASNEWRTGQVAGLNYQSVWATDEALAAAIAAYED